MMRCMAKMMVPKLERKKNPTEEEKEMLALFLHGGDRVDKKNLASVLAWLRE